MITNILIKLAGEQPELIDEVSPESRKKVITQGGLLLIAPFIWFFIGYTFSSLFFTDHIIYSIITGFIMSLLVFMIERSILMSNGNVLFVIARFVLAVLMSFLGGELFNLKIFNDDVLNKKYSDMVEEVQQEIDYFQSRSKNSTKEFFEEIDGSGGSGQVGYSTIARKKESQMNEDKTSLSNSKERLSKLHDDYKSGTLVYRRGILTDHKDLMSLVFTDVHVMVIYIFWLSILLILELIVLLHKTCSKTSAYEEQIKAFELIKKNEAFALKDKINRRLKATEEQIEFNNVINSNVSIL